MWMFGVPRNGGALCLVSACHVVSGVFGFHSKFEINVVERF